MNHHLISLVVFVPLLGAFLQLFISHTKSRWIALGSSLMASLFAFLLVLSMKSEVPDLQSGEYFSWISSYSIGYEMGIDGLNALLVLLIAILFPVLIASEWRQRVGVKGVQGLFLMLQCALFGVVCAQDLFLQFFFLGVKCFTSLFFGRNLGRSAS